MCCLLSVIFFIVALFTTAEFEKFICLVFISALFAIADAIYSLANKKSDKN